MTGPTIRPMTDADVPIVRRMDEGVFPDPWTEAQLHQSLDNDRRVHVVATDLGGTGDTGQAAAGDVIVGHAELYCVAPDATLTTIAVAPNAQRRSIATHLLLHLANHAAASGVEALTLEVRHTNQGAHGLYRRFGFAPSGIRRGYYPAAGAEPAEDAIIMWARDIHEPAYQQRLRDIADGLARRERAVDEGVRT